MKVFIFCKSVVSFFIERTGLKHGVKVTSAESKVVDSLRDHCTYNPEAQNKPHLYSRVVSLMDPLDSICQHMISRLQQAIVDHNISVPSQISQLFPKHSTTNSNQLTILS